MSPSNPFIFGGPVRGDEFLDRRRSLRRLITVIRHGGSALVTGEPCIGKTSLLLHLQAQEPEAFDLPDRSLARHYLDGHTMDGWDAERFWREALAPLQEVPAAQAAYGQPRFDFAAWEEAFRALERQGFHFVLLLDEFDALQREPGLHTRAVYGCLRSLASRFRSFSVIATSRKSLTDLNTATRDFTAGSPYFNFMQEVPVRPFPGKAIGELLQRGDRFTPDDRRFLRRIAGRHPYFLQAAAYYLWEAYGESDEAQVRYLQTAQAFYTQVGQAVLDDIWRAWTPYVQMAFTLAALTTIPALLQEDRFDTEGLMRMWPHLGPELFKLERRGFLRCDEQAPTGYTPSAEVMLWYLADHLTALLRPEIALKDWLLGQRWEGLLKGSEKEALLRSIRGMGRLLERGAQVFIEAAAKGAAQGLVGR